MPTSWTGTIYSIVQTEDARIHRVGFKRHSSEYQDFEIELPHDHGLTVGNSVMITIEELK